MNSEDEQSDENIKQEVKPENHLNIKVRDTVRGISRRKRGGLSRMKSIHLLFFFLIVIERRDVDVDVDARMDGWMDLRNDGCCFFRDHALTRDVVETGTRGMCGL